MKHLIFKKIRLIDDLKIETVKEGELFLYGERMSAQVQSKQPGQEISYFKCIKADKTGKNIEYMLMTDKLDKEE